MRRAARALVETRTERVESLHTLEQSQSRLAAGLGRARLAGATVFTPAWREEAGRIVLEAAYAPPPRVARLLKMLSIAMALLVAASVWTIAAHEGPLQFLLPLFTVLAVLALPLVAVGLGSRRAAEEARIAKAIRVALRDEEDRLPPPQRWEDED